MPSYMQPRDSPMAPLNGSAQDRQTCENKMVTKIATKTVTDCWNEAFAAPGACASLTIPSLVGAATCGATIATADRCATREVREELEDVVEECSDVP